MNHIHSRELWVRARGKNDRSLVETPLYGGRNISRGRPSPMEHHMDTLNAFQAPFRPAKDAIGSATNFTRRMLILAAEDSTLTNLNTLAKVSSIMSLTRPSMTFHERRTDLPSQACHRRLVNPRARSRIQK